MGPLLPDADRNDYSLGLQFKHKGWSFTGAYMAVVFEERSTVENGQVTVFDAHDREEVRTRTREAGTYVSVANIISIGIGYNF